MKQRKIKGGLKTKGFRNAPYDKMQKEAGKSESAEYLPHEQAYGKMSAKKVKHSHKVVGKDK